MLKKTSFVIVASMALIWAVAQAQAVPITFGFTGTVTQVTDPSGVLIGYVAPQNAFAGRFTFNSEAEDMNSSNKYGTYRGQDFLFAMQLGTLSFDSSAGAEEIGVYHVPSTDGLTLAAWSFDVGPFYLEEVGLYLDQSSYSLFMDDSLPPTPPPLSAFQINRLSLVGTNGVNISGTVDSLFLVPEPATCLLFGLFGLGILGRHRKS